MGPFWSSWELWEKMCFCLAASIVLVIIGGCGKLIYSHWRIRKYTRIAEERRAKMMEKRQRQDLGSLRRLQVVPFGIRAIESGIEVDGVWISRKNSAITVPPSAKSSPLSGRSASPSPPNGLAETSGTSIPLRDSTVLGSHGLPSVIRESTHPYGSETGHPGSSHENYPIPRSEAEARSARQSALTSEQQRPSKDSSQMRSSGDSVTPYKNSMAKVTSEKVGSIQPTRSQKSPPSSVAESQSTRSKSKKYSRPSSINTTLLSRSGRSASESLKSPTYEPTIGDSSTMSESERSEGSRTLKVPREPLQVRYPRASNGQEMCEVLPRSPIDARPFLEGRKSNLDFLQTKRKSHAAETGQLTPRSKREIIPDRQSSQLVGTTSEGDSNGVFAGQEASGSISSGAADTFKSSEASSRPSTAHMPSPPSSGPQTPRAVLPQEDVSSTIGIALPHGPEPPITRSSMADPAGEPRSFLGPPSFEPRIKANKAVRKVNSAFEVLPAGTFPLHDAPPESDGRRSLDQDGKSRKLQKKNRSRSNSVARSSIFNENL